MIRGLLLAALLLATPMAGCGGSTGAARTGISKNNAVVRFKTQVPDAEVWVDGRFYAGALRGGIEVPPGLYRVEIRHDHHHTVYLELQLVAGQRRVVPVQMAKKLD